MLDQIMNETLLYHEGTISIGGLYITNLRFTDDIDGLAGSESKVSNLIHKLDATSRTYGMEINIGKTQVMTTFKGHFTTGIFLNGEDIKGVNTFKHLGYIIYGGSKKHYFKNSTNHISINYLTKFSVIWNDRNIMMKSKIQLLHSLVS